MTNEKHLRQRRRDAIVRQLAQQPMTVEQLHAWIEPIDRTPVTTLRRDLARLSEAGRVEKAGLGFRMAARWRAVAA